MLTSLVLASSLVLTRQMPVAPTPASLGWSVTEHQMNFRGQPFAYTATAGYIPLKNSSGEVEANVFFTAYEKKGADKTKRPLTFGFNGGPGSSSVWLHMGCLGPKRAPLTPEGTMPPPPFLAVENEESWLEDSDTVVIDAIGAGMSRTTTPGNRKFFGVNADINAFADIIRTYLTVTNRFKSPLFVSGESYGGIRCGGLASALYNKGITLNGMLIVSGTMNFQTLDAARGNDLPYATFVPTFCATAFYHKKLSPRLMKDLDATLAECEQWVEQKYIPALHMGNEMSKAQENEIATKLSEYTGLPKTTVLRTNLKISDGLFYKELLRNEGKTVGRLDGRITGQDANDLGNYHETDPSNQAITGPYVSSFYSYMADDLKMPIDREYYVFGSVHPWDMNASGEYVDTSERLRGALRDNPHLKIIFLCGYTDMACNYYATKYTVRHMDLRPDQRARISFAYYLAGHMMYIEEKSRRKLKVDVAKFYKDAVQ